ncbi:hypothetical protein [Alteromonas sp. KUL49]|uniref:hypothetical protein n=1 Tax=Alteromonas sp. KUL49 TaxID=2480798 RepID=UPI00102F0E8F|nr:hypothetical protein [Alteromonas sp. KUL49]TAP39691.1 hypothetical protein EYS00_10195 [Alteromonas sp. KUL49]GEA11679.1 hypothetical protein KUL49_20540 [Alteromonas sp. KUL49]
MTPNCFMIASSGSSATKWVSRVLNLNESITAWHANEETEDKSTLESEEALATSLATKVAESGNYVGTIHITPWHGTEMQQPIESKGGQFAGLLRHPVFRINSQSESKTRNNAPPKYERYRGNLNLLLKEIPDFFNAFLDKYGTCFSHGQVEFAVVCYRVFKYEIDLLTLDKEKLFFYESLTTEPTEFKRFVSYLCPTLDVTDAYLSNVFEFGKINSHHVVVPKSLSDIYNDFWDEPRRFMFEYILEHFDKKFNTIASYENLNYDMTSFR